MKTIESYDSMYLRGILLLIIWYVRFNIFMHFMFVPYLHTYNTQRAYLQTSFELNSKRFEGHRDNRLKL